MFYISNKNSLKQISLLFVLISYNIICYSQVDNEFWFAAPDVSVGDNNFDIPIVLRISTLNNASNVVISQPANPTFLPINVNIPANSTTTVDLSSYIDNIENKPANTILNYGLHIVSDNLVTVYYEVVSSYCNCNPEIFALKGKNAIGTQFFIPSQATYSNSTIHFPLPFSSFDIVATENNTIVTINPKKNIVGHIANTPFNIL